MFARSLFARNGPRFAKADAGHPLRGIAGGGVLTPPILRKRSMTTRSARPAAAARGLGADGAGRGVSREAVAMVVPDAFGKARLGGGHATAPRDREGERGRHGPIGRIEARAD